MDDREARCVYAAVALHGLLACPEVGTGRDPEWFAGFAVKCADALMAELEKPPAPAQSEPATE